MHKLKRGRSALPYALAALILLQAMGISGGAAIFTPIAELHNNNASGVPYLLEEPVMISGVVTVSDQFGNIAYLQDSTGGVAVFDAGFVSSVSVGDSVAITGTVSQFNGLTELTDVILDSLLAGGSVTAQLVTGADIEAEGSGGVETLEGELVRITGVSLSTLDQTWTPNKAYSANDGTASFTIYIDRDTEIWGNPVPKAVFNIVGVLGQYDTQSPYTEGYQVLPRFLEDVEVLEGPVFKSKLLLVEQEAMSVTVRWMTEDSSYGRVVYGTTQSYELGTAVDTVYGVEHTLTIEELQPSVFYHARAEAWADADTSGSDDLYFITASSAESMGEIQVYFNKSVDHSYATEGNEAAGNANLVNILLERITAAEYTIDACLYSLSLDDVAWALVSAHNRGVRVRFIYDDDHSQYSVQTLRNAGITVIDDSFGANDGSGLQHNKFIIFDARGGDSDADDWVLTGSTNWTSIGTNTNIQNLVLLQDRSLAKVYTKEFDEMWGSVTDMPNADSSRFSVRKEDNSPHRFNIGGVPVEMYMSPSDATTSKIITEISRAEHSVHFCILSFTRDDISGVMRNKFETVPFFWVRGVFDAGGINDNGGEFEGMSQWADVYADAESGTLHHKYMIVDGNNPDSEPVVITGSHNWSNSAETKNNENTLVIHDAAIANQYMQEFAGRYKAASGNNLPVSVVACGQVVPDGFNLAEAYPNPFNPSTTIGFSLPGESPLLLTVHDLLGREVARLVDGTLPAGRYNAVWDAAGMSSGVYFVRLQAGGMSAVKKIVFLK